MIGPVNNPDGRTCVRGHANEYRVWAGGPGRGWKVACRICALDHAANWRAGNPRPKGVHVQARKEDIEFLRENGLTLEAIAAKFGILPASLTRWMYRQGMLP